MNKAFLTTKVTPVIVLILCSLLYLSGYFQIIIAAFLVLIASAIEYRKDLFKSLGFQKKRMNLKDLLITAPLFSGGLFLIYSFVLVPGVTYLTGQEMDFSAFDSYNGSLSATLGLLILMWASAAFGEEIIFRGYLMRQFEKFFGNSKISLVLNIALLGVLFGFLHAYQGITGQIVTGIVGVLLAIIFYLRKYDLWFNIAVHGFFDTIALVFIYKGWY
ncbi:type II CAAX endopeptidase family protein [Salegentibacter sp. F188]|uniref:Type II CAAX endopeptidase family protein n=1 Tax=Autumnicola patrickiae TaxID=3075591 RepID=A0ABU3E2Z5_9FLAO|nr:type II CAAX endopeptidase family protein [Salegentibacter sp. F188]MDT0690348.1 type II CAAX endopeptidase family protein [Salegentibacter sp. F188]